MASSGHKQLKTCFIAMPITTPNFYKERLGDEDHFNHVLEHLFKPALDQAQYTVIPPSVLGSELIHAEIIKNLEQADLVLCDLSCLNPNVFFELGIRTSLDRAVAIVKDSLTSPIPFDLNAINILTYDGSLTPWTLDKERERLAHHINNAGRTANRGNAMWRYFGLTKRASPAQAESNPLEAKVDLLIAEIAKLGSTSTIQGRVVPKRDWAVDWFYTAIRPTLPKAVTVFSVQYDDESDTVVVHTTGRPMTEDLKRKIEEMADTQGLNVYFRYMNTTLGRDTE